MIGDAMAAEVAMGDAVTRQGTADPGRQPPGSVLVVAIAPHKADGIRYLPGQQYYLEGARARAAAHRKLVHIVDGKPLDWWNFAKRVLSPWEGDEEVVFTREQSPGALKIAQGVGYDPGSQGYRFHSAINQCTKHASAFIRWGDSNPFSSLRQFDGEADAHYVREAILGAKVLHCHINYLMLNNSGIQPQPGQVVIRHYHGSIHPQHRERLGVQTWVDPVWDQSRFAVMVGARLTLLEEARQVGEKLGIPVHMDWLPITVPVARYRMLSRERPLGGGYRAMVRKANEPKPVDEPLKGFRIAHCPTDELNKGTQAFLKVCERLNRRGLAVIPVLMRTLKQQDALAMKATCDATFDSFWLGIQTSGIEAGALQQPCLAGDAEVAQLYRDRIGYVPYTFTPDERALEEQIERLIVDGEYRQAEADKVARYVEEYHDYPAVARIYEGILARALKRDDVFTVARSPEVGSGADPQQSPGPPPEVGGASPPAPTAARRKRGRAA